MLSIYMFHKIRSLKKLGKSNSEVARELGIHRQTVAKYLQAGGPLEYQRQKATRENPFIGFEDKFKSYLERERAEKKLSSVVLFELLVEDGYKGSLRTVKRRLKDYRDNEEKERFFEQKYSAAEQSQFDFKESIKLTIGKTKEQLCHLHFGTLPHSDKFFIRAYPAKNFECYMDGIYEFFSHIGGMTENIRIDNLSPCVKKVYKGDKRKYTDAFNKAIEYFGFGVLPCGAGKGNEKGDVERDIRTHANRILDLIAIKGISFDSFEDLNNWLHDYCIKRESEKIKSLYIEEQKQLRALLPKKETIVCRTKEVIPTPYGMIKDGDCTYSIPDNVIGRKCLLIYGVYEVKIKLLDNKELVARHPRGASESIKLEHVISSLLRKPKAMIRWSHKDALFPSQIYRKLYNKIKKTSVNPESDYLKILNLIHHSNINELTAAIELALDSNEQGYYVQIKELLTVGRYPSNVVDLTEKFKQEKLNIGLCDYDNLIPKGEKDDSSRTCGGTSGAQTNGNEKRVLKFSDPGAGREK